MWGGGPPRPSCLRSLPLLPPSPLWQLRGGEEKGGFRGVRRIHSLPGSLPAGRQVAVGGRHPPHITKSPSRTFFPDYLQLPGNPPHPGPWSVISGASLRFTGQKLSKKPIHVTQLLTVLSNNVLENWSLTDSCPNVHQPIAYLQTYESMSFNLWFSFRFMN